MKKIYLLAFVLLAIAIAGCSSRLTGKEIAKMVENRVDSIKTLKMKICEKGERNDTIYVVMKRPDKSYTRHADGSITIMNGTKEWDFAPKENTWYYTPSSSSVQVLSGKEIYTGVLSLMKKKCIRLTGEKNGCYILEVKENNTTIDIWISKKLEFPVKMVAYKNGKFAEEVEFKDVEINVPVNDSLFYPKGGKIVNVSKLVDVTIQRFKTENFSLRELEKKFGVKLFVPSIEGLKYRRGMCFVKIKNEFAIKSKSFSLSLDYVMHGHNVSLEEDYPGVALSEKPNRVVLYDGVKVTFFVEKYGRVTFNSTQFCVGNYSVLISTEDVPFSEVLKITESAISNGLKSNVPPLTVNTTILYYTHKMVPANSIQKLFKYLDFKPIMFRKGWLEDVFVDYSSDSVTFDYSYKNQFISIQESKSISIPPNAVKHGNYYVYTENYTESYKNVTENITSLHIVFRRNGVWIDASVLPYHRMSKAEEMKLLMEFAG